MNPNLIMLKRVFLFTIQGAWAIILAAKHEIIVIMKVIRMTDPVDALSKAWVRIPPEP
jgi:hypothetical protein